MSIKGPENVPGNGGAGGAEELTEEQRRQQEAARAQADQDRAADALRDNLSGNRGGTPGADNAGGTTIGGGQATVGGGAQGLGGFGYGGIFGNTTLNVDQQQLNDLTNKFFNYTMNIGSLPFGIGTQAMQNSIGAWFQAIMNCFQFTNTTTTVSGGGTFSIGGGSTVAGGGGGTTTLIDTKKAPEGYTQTSKEGVFSKDGKFYKYENFQLVECKEDGSALTAAADPADNADPPAQADPPVDAKKVPEGYEKTNIDGVFKKGSKYYKYDASNKLIECKSDGSALGTAPKRDEDTKKVPEGYEKTNVDGVFKKGSKYYKYDASNKLIECKADGTQLSTPPAVKPSYGYVKNPAELGSNMQKGIDDLASKQFSKQNLISLVDSNPEKYQVASTTTDANGNTTMTIKIKGDKSPSMSYSGYDQTYTITFNKAGQPTDISDNGNWHKKYHIKYHANGNRSEMTQDLTTMTYNSNFGQSWKYFSDGTLSKYEKFNQKSGWTTVDMHHVVESKTIKGYANGQSRPTATVPEFSLDTPGYSNVNGAVNITQGDYVWTKSGDNFVRTNTKTGVVDTFDKNGNQTESYDYNNKTVTTYTAKTYVIKYDENLKKKK
ncbi:hypothetical protein IJ818_03540 [bacterium]|nr:hypothetical protein [bacterium]